MALQADLETLLGALSIYSRAKRDNERKREREREDKDKKVAQDSMKRRVEAQEKHAQVGEYEVEKFWL